MSTDPTMHISGHLSKTFTGRIYQIKIDKLENIKPKYCIIYALIFIDPRDDLGPGTRNHNYAWRHVSLENRVVYLMNRGNKSKRSRVDLLSYVETLQSGWGSRIGGMKKNMSLEKYSSCITIRGESKKISLESKGSDLQVDRCTNHP